MSRPPAIVDRETGEIVVFDPSKTADYLIGIEAVKARAARMKDWPTMELAIAEQVDLQRDHVAWWRANVRGPGRHGNSPRPARISEAEAENLTQISHMAVRRNVRPDCSAANCSGSSAAKTIARNTSIRHGREWWATGAAVWCIGP
jgi:hypothetical protein